MVQNFYRHGSLYILLLKQFHMRSVLRNQLRTLQRAFLIKDLLTEKLHDTRFYPTRHQYFALSYVASENALTLLELRMRYSFERTEKLFSSSHHFTLNKIHCTGCIFPQPIKHTFLYRNKNLETIEQFCEMWKYVVMSGNHDTAQQLLNYDNFNVFSRCIILKTGEILCSVFFILKY